MAELRVEYLGDAGRRGNTIPEAELGQLVRWSLLESVSGMEPPADTWPKILTRVRSLQAPRRFRVWHCMPLLAPLLKAAVLSVLLVAFGLELARNVPQPPKSTPPQSASATRRPLACREHSEHVAQATLTQKPGEILVHHIASILEGQILRWARVARTASAAREKDAAAVR